MLTIKKATKIMNKNGGSLYLSGTGITAANVKRLKNGDYVQNRYLYADNILTHIKREKKIGNYTLYIGKIKNRNVVTDGVNYSHCNTLKDGIADLNYKNAVERGADQYKNISVDDKINTADAITMYRVITGACKQGTQNFIENLSELKESYTVSEIIELTRGHYGADTFKKFFE